MNYLEDYLNDSQCVCRVAKVFQWEANIFCFCIFRMKVDRRNKISTYAFILISKEKVFKGGSQMVQASRHSSLKVTSTMLLL